MFWSWAEFWCQGKSPGGNKVYRDFGYSDASVGLKFVLKETELKYRAGIPAEKQKSKGVEKSFGVAGWEKEQKRYKERKHIMEQAIKHRIEQL